MFHKESLSETTSSVISKPSPLATRSMRIARDAEKKSHNAVVTTPRDSKNREVGDSIEDADMYLSFPSFASGSGTKKRKSISSLRDKLKQLKKDDQIGTFKVTERKSTKDKKVKKVKKEK